MAFGFVLLWGAVYLSNYVLLIVSALIFGTANGTAYAAIKSVYFSGIKPDPRFESMLCTKLESAIAPAIGASIGSVLRSIWGDTALIIYVLVICALYAAVILNFVYNDINASGSSEENAPTEFRKKPLLQRLKNSAGFYLRPDIICMMAAALIPIYILDAVGTYIMPLFNQQVGLSDVYIGLITFLMTMVSIFVVPKILELANSGKRSEPFWIAVLMGILTIAFALFGFGTDMKTMVLVVIAIRMFNTVFNAMSTRMNSKQAALAGLNPNDTDVGFEIVSTASSMFNNIILGLMITAGYTAFGWIWCAVCAVCTAGAAIICRMQRGQSQR